MERWYAWVVVLVIAFAFGLFITAWILSSLQ